MLREPETVWVRSPEASGMRRVAALFPQGGKAPLRGLAGLEAAAEIAGRDWMQAAFADSG